MLRSLFPFEAASRSVRFFSLAFISILSNNAFSEWKASIKGVELASGNSTAVCSAALRLQLADSASALYEKCDINDRYVGIKNFPSGGRSSWLCIFHRSIQPCSYHPSGREEDWHLQLFYYKGDTDQGSSSTNTCHPINVATGNKYFRQTDVRIPISFSRYYNSLSGWSYDYMQNVQVSDKLQLVTANRPDGSSIEFYQDDEGYQAASNRRERIYVNDDGYLLKLADNIEEQYSSDGRLQKIINNGNTYSLEYFEQEITVYFQGKSITLALNNNGDLSGVSQNDNSLASYQYKRVNSIYMLEKVIFFDGSEIGYLYDDENFSTFVTSIRDENGNIVSNVSYDGKGRAVSSVVPISGSDIFRTSIEYNDNGTSTVTNTLGKKSIVHFHSFNGQNKITKIEGLATQTCLAANKLYIYDNNGFLASKTDWQGNVTEFTQNSLGQKLSRTEAAGTPQARTITTEWHAEFDLPTRIVEPDREITLNYDAQGRLLSRQVNYTTSSANE